jgi:hypothetical protein
LVVAAVLLAVTGLAHSWLGERYLISRLLRRPDLPELFGDDSFTRSTIRFAWHLTTVAWLGLAGVLLFFGGALTCFCVARGVVLSIAAALFASGALALVLTRGRHLSWIVFLAACCLCLWAAS